MWSEKRGQVHFLMTKPVHFPGQRASWYQQARQQHPGSLIIDELIRVSATRGTD